MKSTRSGPNRAAKSTVGTSKFGIGRSTAGRSSFGIGKSSADKSSFGIGQSSFGTSWFPGAAISELASFSAVMVSSARKLRDLIAAAVKSASPAVGELAPDSASVSPG